MPRLVVLLAGLAFAAPAQAFELRDAAALADAYFEQIYGFDGLEAYESRMGSATTSYAVSRKWSGGEAKVLIDFLEPSSASKIALLLFHRRDRADDLFVYLPGARRVLRLSPAVMQEPRPFNLLSIADLRPIAPGELDYRVVGHDTVEDVECLVVEGRPRVRGLGFDRIELALARETGLTLRTRFFEGSRELRRVLVAPDDYRDYDGRRLLSARGERAIEIVLRNVLVDVALPDALFTRHSLEIQRFPRF